MKKILLAFFLLLGTSAFAQQKGIGYQAVIINPKQIAAPGYNALGTPLANKSVCMSFQILNAASQVEYQETQTLNTDQFGMVNLIIGNGTKTGGSANTLATLTWGLGIKTLVVSVNTDGTCNDYTEISRQALNYAPYALYAEDANVKDGAITTAKLADGSVTDAKVAMGISKSKVGLSNVDNTSDALKPVSTATQTALNLKANTADLINGFANKVDKVTGKDLSTNDYTTAEKAKLAAITGTNTGDQDLSALATVASVTLKANASDVTSSLATKVDKVTGKELSTNDYTTAEKTKLAAITGINTGDQDLSALATVASVALKANTADVNTALSLKANVGDVTSGLANKVDKVTGKELSTNDYTTAEKTKLAAITGTNTGDQDLSALATAASVALKANDADVNNALSLKANSSDLTSGLANKVDKVTGKDLSTNDYTTTEKNKLTAITGTNTGDQDLSALATAASVSLKADIVSPSLTGIPTAPTAASSTNTTQIATTAFVTNATAGKFVDLTTNQTIAGAKTFSTDISVNGLTVGKGTGQNDQNTAIGAGALSTSNASGTRNTAVGYLALKDYRGTSFDNNTGVGYFNMIGLTTGYGNTSIGAETMFNVGTASNNTGVGNQSLINATGDNNVGVGARSGDGLTTGTNNTFVGTQARTTNAGATISNATALGYGAVVTENNTIQLGNLGVTNVKTSGTITAGSITYPNTDGTIGQVLSTNGSGVVEWSTPATVNTSSFVDVTTNQTIAGAKTFSSDLNVNGLTVGKGLGNKSNNTAIGSNTLNSNTSGFLNTASGFQALNLNTSGNYNTAIGGNSLNANTTGSQNTSVGIESMLSNTTGNGNTALGRQSLASNQTGNFNTGLGIDALAGNTTGSYGVGLGQGALATNTTGRFNTAVGPSADVASGNLINATAIGNGAIVAASNTIQLGNTAVTNVTTSGAFTGSSFKTPTGTPTQYLMADGSVSTSSSGSSSQWTTSNNDIYFSTGKVGIGLTNPGSIFNTNFDVSGRSSFRINSSTQALIIDGSSGFSRIYTDAGSGTPDNLILGTYPNGHSKQLFLKQSNGYVGINNDDPSEQLDITGSVKATGFKTPTGTSSQYLMADGSVSSSSSSSGVPYTGATASVDLGTHNISASHVTGSYLYVSSINDMAISMGASVANETNFLGSSSMGWASPGFANTAFGHLTLSENSGDENTAFGAQSMRGNTSGYGNTALGRSSLSGNTTGFNNTAIGAQTGVLSQDLNNTTAIGAGAVVSASNTIQLGNSSVTNVKTSGTITAGAITYPNITGTNGQVLTADGNGTATWVSAKNESNSIICKIADAPNTILSIGGFEFRYNSTVAGGFIEVRSGGNDNMMVFSQKNTGSWDLGGATSTQNYRANTSVYSAWVPVISLWGGTSWSDRVTLSVYETFEATMFSMGNGGAIPNPLKSYKLFAAIDGYNQIFLKAEYSIK